ncbi:MAG: hypothetical protein HY293_04900 [Planctomycetes bacterium]|nr:hypothetical protein [Planctomycetota bacterium]
MFSNRGYLWKLGGALALVALLGVVSALRGESLNPPLWRCVAEPRRWDNVVLWVPASKITSIRDSDFEIDTGDARIRVDGGAPAKVGEKVSVRGRFRADGPRIEMTASHVLPPDLLLRRRLIEALSVIVALGVLANFARHFLFRPKVLHIGKGEE